MGQRNFEPMGERLFQTLVSLTGLPEPMVRQELDRILENAGHPRETVTLDQLRLAMMEYLDSIHDDIHLESPGGAEVLPN